MSRLASDLLRNRDRRMERALELGLSTVSAQKDKHGQRLLKRDAAMKFLLNKDSSSMVSYPNL